MKERPIIFSAEMVRAILDGRKTQTRRIMRPQPPHGCHYVINDNQSKACCFGDQSTKAFLWCVPPTPRSKDHLLPCPYGKPGDRLWVRESFSGPHDQSECPPSQWMDIDPVWYWADGNPENGDWTIPKPSIHMPRWASRISLEIVSVRVERLHDISEGDAIADGAETMLCESMKCAGSFIDNPWVWVVGFRKIKT